MASHLGALGFPATTREEFEAVGVLAASLGESFDAGSQRYVRWAPGEGIELWTHADPVTKKIRGLTPYFTSGKARLEARVVALVEDPRRPAEGAALVTPGDDPRRAALEPVSVALPDFRLLGAGLTAGSEASLSVAGFAHALEVREDAATL